MCMCPLDVNNLSLASCGSIFPSNKWFQDFFSSIVYRPPGNTRVCIRFCTSQMQWNSSQISEIPISN